MNKDTKVLLMAVVIILVALVSFNIGDLTGKLVKSNDVTTLTVSPTIITFNKHDTAKMITLRVSPSSKGIDKKVLLYKGGNRNTQISSETATLCTNNICYDDVTISYRLTAGLKEGKYYFGAERENTNQKFVSNEFEIKHI